MVSFRNLMIDVCGRTVTVHKSSRRRLTSLLDRLGVEYRPPPIGHPFDDATLQLATEEDLNMLLLVVYGEVVESSSLCRRPPPNTSGGRRVWFSPPSPATREEAPRPIQTMRTTPDPDVASFLIRYLTDQTEALKKIVV